MRVTKTGMRCRHRHLYPFPSIGRGHGQRKCCVKKTQSSPELIDVLSTGDSTRRDTLYDSLQEALSPHAPVSRHWCQVPGPRSETPRSRRDRGAETARKRTAGFNVNDNGQRWGGENNSDSSSSEWTTKWENPNVTGKSDANMGDARVQLARLSTRNLPCRNKPWRKIGNRNTC